MVFAASLAGGFVGSLTGLGGGVIVTPVLTVLMGVDIRYAIGAILIAVIATSSGAAASYVKDGYSNIRIGMFLEIATTLGALVGAFLGTRIPTTALSIIFGIMLLQAAWQSARKHAEHAAKRPPYKQATRLKLAGAYETEQGLQKY